MPGSILQISLIAQLPLAQAGQLLLVIGIAFAIITVVSSTYRFHKMIQLGEDELVTVEDCNDFFFIQVTRYLSKINRTSSGFGVFILQFSSETDDKRKVQKELFDALEGAVRKASDKVCLFRSDCVAAIIDTEQNHVPMAAQRLADILGGKIATLSGVSAVRSGVSIFPRHGLNTQTLIDAATNALETIGFDSPQTLCIASAPETAEESKAESESIGELSRQDKNAALDPLTGVLKPTVVGSYMRKYLDEIRRSKKPAVLLCVGVSRIDKIIELHGELAADDVIAGVGQILQRLTRDCDLIGRYHRDDFLVLAPCTLQQGEMIATRLREAVQKEIFVSGVKRIKTAVSIGITAHPEHGRNLRDLFRCAYRALEVIREWNTTACLVYDPEQHGKKAAHEPRR
jgi:diguanylate cyclase (GGDEF)-like protein